MPKSVEAQRERSRCDYANYKNLLLKHGETQQSRRWRQHLRELEQRPAPADEPTTQAATSESVPSARPPGYLGVYCVTCQQDCLPLEPYGICGFCSRLPATGEIPDSDEIRAEILKQRWRENTRAHRARKREAA